MRIFIMGNTHANLYQWTWQLEPYFPHVPYLIHTGNWLNTLDQPAIQEANHHMLNALTWATSTYQYRLLLGPNETLILNYPTPFIDPNDLAVLTALPVAPAVAFNGLLLSYGGLTYHRWLDLDQPQTADEAASRLTETFMFPHPGYGLLFTGRTCFDAPPTIAHAWYETIQSWQHARHVCPFPQLVGQRFTRYANHDTQLRVRTTASADRVRINGQLIVGCNDSTHPYISREPFLWGQATLLGGPGTTLPNPSATVS